MKINPYLTFDGRCEKAFAFYARCFGTRINAVMHHRHARQHDGW